MKHLLDNELFTYFCIHPSAELGIRALGKEMNVSPTQVSRLAEPLIKEEILNVKVIGRNKVLSSNKQNQKFVLYKKWNNLILLIKEGIMEEFAKDPVQSAILFGSFRRGEDIETSDIDIAISEKKGYDFSKIEKKMKRKIVIHDINSISIEDVKQGTVLFGEMPSQEKEMIKNA